MKLPLSLFPAQRHTTLKAVHKELRHGLMRKCMIIILTNFNYETMHKVPVFSTFYFPFFIVSQSNEFMCGR